MKILGMEVYRRKTDEEFIESVRKNLRCPWWYRCLMLSLSLLYIGCIIFGGWVIIQIVELTEQPHKYDLGLIVGFVLGLFLSGIAANAGHVFYNTIRPMSEQRIERLLLRYHDELQALGRIPQTGKVDNNS